MDTASPLAGEVRRALEADGHIHSIRGYEVGTRGRDVILHGVVDDVPSKKRALRCAGATPGVARVVDRLLVRASTPMSDAEIRDRLAGELLDEPTLANLTLRLRAAGGAEVLPHPPFQDAEGELRVRVESGRVTLDGSVPGLAHKRLAGVLAWWVSGVRDVVNGIGVDPPERDSDDEIVDALRIVLAKDRLLDSGEVQVGCRDRVVLLEGAVPTVRQKHMAELDAWCLFGVDRVESRLRVVTPPEE